MDVRFLLTLNQRDYTAGLCEALKMAITSDRSQARFFFDNSSLFVSPTKNVSELVV